MDKDLFSFNDEEHTPAKKRPSAIIQLLPNSSLDNQKNLGPEGKKSAKVILILGSNKEVISVDVNQDKAKEHHINSSLPFN